MHSAWNLRHTIVWILKIVWPPDNSIRRMNYKLQYVPYWRECRFFLLTLEKIDIPFPVVGCGTWVSWLRTARASRIAARDKLHSIRSEWRVRHAERTLCTLMTSSTSVHKLKHRQDMCIVVLLEKNAAINLPCDLKIIMRAIAASTETLLSHKSNVGAITYFIFYTFE